MVQTRLKKPPRRPRVVSSEGQLRLTAGLALVVLVLGAVAPLGPALWAGTLPGAGPDVVSSTWGAWWLQASGPAGLAGADSDLANHPYGVQGAVLSPLTTGGTALLWSVLGPGRAVAAVAALHALALAAATGFLAHVAGARGPGPWLAAAAVTVGRVLPYSVGEASVVAVAALPVPLGLAALLSLPAAGRWRPVLVVVVALCTGWTALENPYLAPLLPILSLAAAALRWRQPLAEGAAAAAGGLLLVLVLRLFSASAAPDYPSEVDGTVLALGSLEFTLVDLPWSRVRPEELFTVEPVRWTLHSDGARSAGGGRTLGLSVCLLALVGLVLRPRRAGPWLLGTVVLVVLAMGSAWNDVGLPFVYANALLSEVARPLTQPVRFLVPALLALSIAAAHGGAALVERWSWTGIVIGCMFLVESSTVGGASLRLPTTAVPEVACAARLDGPVLVWPADATDGAHSRSQLVQMAHGQSAAHRAIASWARPRGDVLPELRAAGVRVRGLASPPQTPALRALGYRWLLLEPGASPADVARLERVLGPPGVDCGAWRAFPLGR